MHHSIFYLYKYSVPWVFSQNYSLYWYSLAVWGTHTSSKESPFPFFAEPVVCWADRDVLFPDLHCGQANFLWRVNQSQPLVVSTLTKNWPIGAFRCSTIWSDLIYKIYKSSRVLEGPRVLYFGSVFVIFQPVFNSTICNVSDRGVQGRSRVLYTEIQVRLLLYSDHRCGTCRQSVFPVYSKYRILQMNFAVSRRESYQCPLKLFLASLYCFILPFLMPAWKVKILLLNTLAL